MQVFNARTQQMENVKWTVDANSELVATFTDRGFLKFPPGLDKNALQKLVDEVREANEGQVVITPEAEAKAKEDRKVAEALVNELNGVESAEETPSEE